LQFDNFMSLRPDTTAPPRLRLAGRLLEAFALGVALALPAFAVGYWIAVPAETLTAAAGSPPTAGDVWPPWARATGLVITAVPMAALIWAILGARRCFREMASGRLVSPAMTRGLKSMAAGMALSALLRPLAGVAASALASWAQPPGARSVSLNVSSDLLVLLVFAAAVWVVAHAIDRAAAVADDHARFV
jgi:hypothetical protein